MRSAVLVLALIPACGGGGKGAMDPGDGWTVKVAACEAEAARANHERTFRTTGDQLAAAVFAYAECERARLARAKVTVDTVTDFAEDVNHARELYWEAFRTHEPRWEIGAFARIGDLYARSARQVEGLGADGAGRVGTAFRTQAERAWRWALRYADDAPPEVLADERVAAWLRAACAGLRATTEDPVCVR